jgi:hypothetical protein
VLREALDVQSNRLFDPGFQRCIGKEIDMIRPGQTDEDLEI